MSPYRFPLLALALLVMFSGCATPSSSPRITSQLYPRIGLITLFRDDAAVSSASSFFAIPKGGILELPGLAPALTKGLSAKFTAAGYQVITLPLGADQYWRAFAATAATKEGTNWHLGAHKNARLTVQNLVQQGAITVGDVDAVLIVGPSEFYYDSSFLSQKGDLVVLHTLGSKPGLLSGSLTLHAVAINAKTMESAGSGRAIGHFSLGTRKFQERVAELGADERAELVRSIQDESAKIYDLLVKSLK